MKKAPQDLERLIYEVLEIVGWEAGPHELAERVQRLNKGLPIEDEFIVLCTWLNRCNLIHKLDQQQMPLSSKEKVQVPDLLAQFTTNGKAITVLIEVKHHNDNVLSFRPDYYSKLLQYGQLLGLPVLIAWKNKLDIWTLFDIAEMSKAKKNYNINIKHALCENLLGILAGDFSYKVYPDCALSITFTKEDFIEQRHNEEKEKEELWKTTITDVSVYNGKSEKLEKVPVDIQSIFHTINLKEYQIHKGKDITLCFTPENDSMYFAQHAIVKLLNFTIPDDESLHWRQYIGNNDIYSKVENFYNAAKDAMEQQIVSHIFNIVPHNIPKYIL